jgi:hypothetical protein
MDTNETHASTQDRPTVGGFSGVPTTKVLAIGRLQAPLTTEQRKAIMPHEVPDTVNMYLDGKIDQWWSRQDGKGPVFLLNVSTLNEAKKLMASLPLSLAGLMECDFIELGPLRPLRLLLKEG